MVAQRLRVTRAPALLYQESDLVLKAMRDLFTPDITEVVVDSEDVYLRIKDFADKLMRTWPTGSGARTHDAAVPRLRHREGRRGALPAEDRPANGASIVIDQAEALVAIDVNSGKFKPGADLEETAYRTDLDAIPRSCASCGCATSAGSSSSTSSTWRRRSTPQRRERLIEALRGDRARIKVGRISPFGMLEITRQRVGPGLKRTVFMQCRTARAPAGRAPCRARRCRCCARCAR